MGISTIAKVLGSDSTISKTAVAAPLTIGIGAMPKGLPATGEVSPAPLASVFTIRTAPALRAFIRVAPDIVKHLDQGHADRADFRAIGRIIAPWGRRIGDLRFETDGAWKRSGSTVDQLAKELKLALQYPEGAMV
jgi:hypothetical protein